MLIPWALIFGSRTPDWIDRIYGRCLGSIQRCLTLYLASLDGDSGDAEAGETRNMDGIQLGSIEPLVHSRKGANQCAMDRGFCRFAECLRRVRIRQPHKVPANAADCRIQLRCFGPDRLCPSPGKRLLKQIELAGQGTLVPQEYRVDLHSSLLAGGLSNRFRPESNMIGIDAEDTLGEESSKGRASAEVRTLFFLAADLIPARPGWLTIPNLPSLMARRAAKYLSTSIFLISAIAAPLVLFVSSADLIGSAEGSGLELAQASSRCVGRASNCVARYDQFHSAVLLPSSGVIIRGYGGTIAEARCAD